MPQVDPSTVTLYLEALPPPPGPPKPQSGTPRLRLIVHDTVTGRVNMELPYTKLTASSKINAYGTMQATIPIGEKAPELKGVGLDERGEELRRFLDGPFRWSVAICYGDVVLWDGVLLPSTDGMTTGQQEVEIGCAEFCSIFETRILINDDLRINAYFNDQVRDIVLANTTPAGAIARLIIRATTDVYELPGRKLPIISTDQIPYIGTDTFVYKSYDLTNAWKAIQDFTKGEDGPDIRFDPFLVDIDGRTHIYQNLRVGTPYLDTGPMWTWDDSVTPMTRTKDAVGFATKLFVSGTGQDRAKAIYEWVSYDLPIMGFPTVERVQNFSEETATLPWIARNIRALFDARQTPTETWAFTTNLDGPIPAGAYRVGELEQVRTHGHPIVRPGEYQQRIVTWDLDADGDGAHIKIGLGVEDDEGRTSSGSSGI